MQSPTAPVISTASVILLKDDKILMVQEGKPMSKDLWNLPGGRFEPNEPVEECAKRECLEETGYTVKLTALLGAYKYVSYGKYDMIRFVYYAEIISQQEEFWHHEIQGHQWFTLEELSKKNDAEFLAPNSIRAIIKDIIQGEKYPLSTIKWC